MNKKISMLLGFLPLTAFLRGKVYKILCGGIGQNFKIGFGSYIDSKVITIGDNCTIGNMVRMKYLDDFELGDNSSIGSSTVVCGAYPQNRFKSRSLKIGKHTGILCSHYFDVVAPICIGDHVTIVESGLSSIHMVLT